jgi:ATP-binding cassette subfamily B protein
VLHHGEIREQGTHQELLTNRGLYWMLYKLQYSETSRAQTSEKPVEELPPRRAAPRMQFSE